MYNIEEIKRAKTTEEFEFVCAHCGRSFKKTKREISKNNYALPKFCCQKCQKEWYKENSYVTVKCKKCGKEFRILKSTYDKSENKHFFCSHSCSASYNNTKRERKRSEIQWVDKEKRKIKERTLGSFIDGHKYLSTKCNEIRKDARRIIEESKREKVCAYCHNHEFDDILEVHHIKGILQFDRNATIGEINDEDNLVWLCPNHHKMLEMGLITLHMTP